MAASSNATKRGAEPKLASSNIATKLAEKEAQDASPPWSRVLPLAMVVCVCAVLASPGSAIGPDGPVLRFAAVTAKLAARDAGGAGEAEARSAVAPAVAALQGRVLVLGAGAYPSLLALPGLGANAVPVDERPLLMPALASAALEAGAAAPLNLSASNFSNLPDASVDALVSLGALCRANLTAALPELRRVLKAGSPLIVFEPTLSLSSTTTRRLQVGLPAIRLCMRPSFPPPLPRPPLFIRPSLPPPPLLSPYPVVDSFCVCLGCLIHHSPSFVFKTSPPMY